jgi:hypothetical protein
MSTSPDIVVLVTMPSTVRGKGIGGVLRIKGLPYVSSGRRPEGLGYVFLPILWCPCL